mgnify:CR=1 FL=1
MIYLDYSANTPASPGVLERFCEVERSCPGNANSRHQAGRAGQAGHRPRHPEHRGAFGRTARRGHLHLRGQRGQQLRPQGSGEALPHAGRHIISTPVEHSSVSGTLTALQEQGYEIDLVDIRRDGTIDLGHLKELLRPDTIAVAVTLVDSELGVVQPVKEISELLAGMAQLSLTRRCHAGRGQDPRLL